MKKRVINYLELAPDKLMEVFVKNNMYFKRELRISVLKKIMEPRYIQEKNELTKLKNENPNAMKINDATRLYRLKHYKSLSEFQLENDFIYYKDKNLVNSYLELFWEELVNYIETLGNADAIFSDIENLEKQNVVIKSVCDYNRYFSSIVLDDENCFDGIHLEKAVSHFNNTSLATEIKKLGEKYRIKTPSHWTKEDLQIRLRKVLKNKNKLTPELSDKIKNSSIKNLKVLLDENKADSKMHITKEDLIEIIIKSVDKNKVSEVASFDDDYEEDEVTEEIIKKEDKVVMPEIKKEKVVVVDQMDYRELLKTIIANQEILISQNNNVNVNETHSKDFKLSRVFNIVVLILIIIVALIWIVYGINTLF